LALFHLAIFTLPTSTSRCIYALLINHIVQSFCSLWFFCCIQSNILIWHDTSKAWGTPAIP
jgi:hypothetical protein